MKASIGNRIKALRKQQNISQEKLCHNPTYPGILNRSILSRIENNKMQPSIAQMRYIAEKLDVPVNYFLSNLNYEDSPGESSPDLCNDLQKLFKEEKHYDIIKCFEFYPADFRLINDINKYYFLGMSFFNLNILREAVYSLKRYFNEYTKSLESVKRQNSINIGIALNTISKIMIKTNCLGRAEKYLIAAIKNLSIYSESNSLIYFVIHNNLAYVYNQTAQFEKTIALVEGILNSYGNLTYMQIIPHLHKAMGIASYNLDNYDKATEHIKKSILLYSYKDNKEGIGYCHINCINLLRYSGRFSVAFEVISKFKKLHIGSKKLYNKFVIQELIVKFNCEDYDSILSLVKELNFNEFQKTSISNIYFMLGHIYFLRKDYKKALEYFRKCEKYFIEKKYFKDLTVMWEDLFTISQDNQYTEKIMLYSKMPLRKNIFI